jgi:MYXO-CTERM domain-containing protein
MAGGTVVMTIPETADADVAAASSHVFEAPVVPSPDADYLAYDPEMNLFLVLDLSFERPALVTGPEAPSLQPGGSVTLPLLEYADRVPRRSEVDAGAEPAPDGAGDAKKESPGPTPALTALAVLGLAVALARRRDGLL